MGTGTCRCCRGRQTCGSPGSSSTGVSAERSTALGSQSAWQHKGMRRHRCRQHGGDTGWRIPLQGHVTHSTTQLTASEKRPGSLWLSDAARPCSRASWLRRQLRSIHHRSSWGPIQLTRGHLIKICELYRLNDCAFVILRCLQAQPHVCLIRLQPQPASSMALGTGPPISSLWQQHLVQMGPQGHASPGRGQYGQPPGTVGLCAAGQAQHLHPPLTKSRHPSETYVCRRQMAGLTGTWSSSSGTNRMWRPPHA